MDSAIEKKRLEKLARVRENQRKSRARRQDHLQELEHKVFGLQKELDRRDVEHRLSVQRIEAENRKLRHLHYLSGVSADALEAYLRSVDDPNMAKKIAIPAMRRPEGASRSEPSCARPFSSATGSSSGTPSLVSGRSETSKEDPDESQDFKPEEKLAELPPFCACSPEEDIESLPVNERVLNTTFCAIAEKLVNQYNARGIDVSEIQQKLRQGFFRSSSEEGCRVQNQILFQVLDEISGH